MGDTRLQRQFTKQIVQPAGAWENGMINGKTSYLCLAKLNQRVPITGNGSAIVLAKRVLTT